MSVKNKLVNLNDHLFEQLERLNDEDLTGDELIEEINRSKAITDVATKIIDNGNLVLKAIHEQNEYGAVAQEVPKMLLGAGTDEKSVEQRKG